MHERPLAGRRVLVTRAEDQGEGLARALEALGASVLWIPALRTQPLALDAAGEEALARMGDCSWVAFTSPNAVRYFVALLSERGLRMPPGMRVAAVGAATESALEGAGVSVQARPEKATGRDLGELLTSTCGPATLLLPRGRSAREELPSVLAGAGWSVVPLLCYETLPASVGPREAGFLEGGVDAALFASPSAAKNLWAGLGESGRRALLASVVVPIGPTTSAALKELGLEPATPPEDASVQGLVGALLRALPPLGGTAGEGPA